jgi:hypothetical protein
MKVAETNTRIQFVIDVDVDIAIIVDADVVGVVVDNAGSSLQYTNQTFTFINDTQKKTFHQHLKSVICSGHIIKLAHHIQSSQSLFSVGVFDELHNQRSEILIKELIVM